MVDKHGRSRLREEKLRTRYGMSLDEFDAMFSDQGGACAICGAAKPGGRWRQWAVDHCHNTGAVRGILCNRCNYVLGLLRDSPVLAERYAAYLRASAGGEARG